MTVSSPLGADCSRGESLQETQLERREMPREAFRLCLAEATSLVAQDLLQAPQFLQRDIQELLFRSIPGRTSIHLSTGIGATTAPMAAFRATIRRFVFWEFEDFKSC